MKSSRVIAIHHPRGKTMERQLRSSSAAAVGHLWTITNATASECRTASTTAEIRQSNMLALITRTMSTSTHMASPKMTSLPNSSQRLRGSSRESTPRSLSYLRRKPRMIIPCTAEASQVLRTPSESAEAGSVQMNS